jgi:hypothetical protein
LKSYRWDAHGCDSLHWDLSTTALKMTLLTPRPPLQGWRGGDLV